MTTNPTRRAMITQALTGGTALAAGITTGTLAAHAAPSNIPALIERYEAASRAHVAFWESDPEQRDPVGFEAESDRLYAAMDRAYDALLAAKPATLEDARTKLASLAERLFELAGGEADGHDTATLIAQLV
jgi:hypothetical protein